MKVTLSLKDLSDESMAFVKQIGVDYVQVSPSLLGFQPGQTVQENVSRVVKRIRTAGLNIAFSYGTPIRGALIGRPEGERQLEELCSYIRILGDERVPVVQVFLEEVRRGPSGVPGRYEKKHRGGYRMDAFSLELMRGELAKRDMKAPWVHHFTDKITPEEYFSRCVEICKRIAPVAEEGQVKMALHTDDPPVPDAEGLLPGLWNPLVINSLLEAVPSRNLGLLFCCGTRYESGINIFDQIRLFGRMGKIFYVHFRNVRGTIPSAGAYDEVAIDDGDMDMLDVLKTLREVGYNGAIYPDHLPSLIGDPEGKASIAFAVGYIKALISALRY